MVVGFHGYDVTVFPRHGFIDLGREGASPPPRVPFPYRQLFAELDHALVVSRFLETKLRGLGFDGEIHVVPSGIRLRRFPFRGPRASRDGVRLLFVGRLVPYKGVDVLLRAVSRLNPRIAGLSLEVIGDGPVRAHSQELARELGIGRQVMFLGGRSHEEVSRALQRTDILVVPSRTMPTGQAETLSNVVKEGLAAGVQVVATRSGGIPEAIPPPFQGDLVPENDAAALAGRIEALLAQRESWAQRARLGRAWVEDRFDWGRLAPRIAAAYEAAVRDFGDRSQVRRPLAGVPEA
jgi:glycosyltransferase involved in cell wall biosynthesis